MLNFGGVDFEGVYFFSIELLNRLEVKKGDVPKEKVLRFSCPMFGKRIKYSPKWWCNMVIYHGRK